MKVPDSGFIPRARSFPASQDFALLRREGIEHVERLGHERWTDYNVHDPGITLLELFAYVITDLSRRASYPVADILTRRRQIAFGGSSGVAELNTGDFHLADDVLVCEPVSFEDLRKLLVDVPGIRNAWIEPHRSIVYRLDESAERLVTAPVAGDVKELPPLNGLFDVYLEYEEFVTPEAPAFRARETPFGARSTRSSGFVDADGQGLELSARVEARIHAVTVHAEAAGELEVTLTDATGNEHERRSFRLPRGTSRLVLDFDLKGATTYRLLARGSGLRLERTARARFPFGEGPIRILRGHDAASVYYFFYDWEVLHDSAGFTESEVRAAAVNRIHMHRNLCEDVVNVCSLDPEEVAVCADIELLPEADTEMVQAQIYYRLHHHISPAVRFRSLDELRALGRSIDRIYEGPRLEHGFIDDEEFRALRRRCEVRASDLIQEIMNVDGVVAVRNLRLLSFIDGELREQADWQLRLSSDRFRIARFGSRDPVDGSWRTRSKLVFYKRGLPYYANLTAVAELFREMKAADAQNKLKLRRDNLPPPVGRDRGLARYSPAQNELPAAYLAGRLRVPRSLGPLRKAQSRQLKAYLLLFEQLFANYLAQLANVADLFTWRSDATATYFAQAVTDIAEFEDLVDFPELDVPEEPDPTMLPETWRRLREESAARKREEYAKALRKAVETEETARERRLRFLEHLAARYAEGFGEYAPLLRSLERVAPDHCPEVEPHADADDGPDADERLVAEYRRFLADYPALSSARGTGFDWRRPEVPANVAGYQRRVYALLGIEDATRRELAGHRFEIVEDTTSGVSRFRFELRGGGGVVLFQSESCESKAAVASLLDYALRIGGDERNYATESDETHSLIQCCGDAEPERIGRTLAAGALAEVRSYFDRYGRSEGLHLVEHILFRRRSGDDPFLRVQLDQDGICDCPEVRDPYSFRASIVLPSWSPRFRDMRFRRLVEETLRREAPAHVFLRICWVNHEQMKGLERALFDWQKKLAALAHEPAACGSDDTPTRTGRFPLPKHSTSADEDYAAALERLLEGSSPDWVGLQNLTTVYPLAQLHDCEETTGDTPQVTLNNTSLGTL